MNFLPKVAVGLGFAWSCFSIWKWGFHTLDISQLLFGVLIGAIIVGSGKLYDFILKIIGRMDDLDRGLDGLRVWTVDELEKRK